MIMIKLLLLAITYPEYSNKNLKYSICMSGITENGKFLRIFPIPFYYYLRNEELFKKYNWIQCECRKSGDKRKESYKVNCKSIDLIEKSSKNELKKVLYENLSSLEELKKENDISIGLLKPKVKEINFFASKERLIRKKKLDSQLTLFNSNRLGDNYIPYFIKFDFFCEKSNGCTGHSIICEDIKFWKFIKKEIESRNSISEIKVKVFNNYISDLINDPTTIFMMGTHYLYKTWLIISIL